MSLGEGRETESNRECWVDQSKFTVWQVCELEIPLLIAHAHMMMWWVYLLHIAPQAQVGGIWQGLQGGTFVFFHLGCSLPLLLTVPP